jgi:ABC-type amino acid transport substrate-binding protein
MVGTGLAIRGGAMMKLSTAGLCAALVAGMAFAVAPADAQTATQYYSSGKPRAAATQRPRARVTVAPRSFLDAGTEVRPGDRKFTDYAFPPGVAGGYATGVVTNTGGRVGWDRSPLMNPSELPGGFVPY